LKEKYVDIIKHFSYSTGQNHPGGPGWDMLLFPAAYPQVNKEPARSEVTIMSTRSIDISKHSEGAEEKTYGEEFMLHEYDRLHSLVLNETREAEQRVNYFLTITSAIGGALIVFFQLSALAINIRLVATEGILAILLLYGWLTLNRLNSRVAQLSTFRKLQNEIRGFFAKRDSAIASYIRFYEKALPSKLGWSIIRMLRGTLQELMIATNALICGAIVLVVLVGRGSPLIEIVGWTILAFISTAMLFAIYHYTIRARLPPFVTGVRLKSDQF
jgi:hypothetical protein